MDGGQIKVGLRNALVILLVVMIGVPLLKAAATKAQFVPDPVRNWFLSV